MIEFLRRRMRQALLKIEVVVLLGIYGFSWVVAGLAIYNMYWS